MGDNTTAPGRRIDTVLRREIAEHGLGPVMAELRGIIREIAEHAPAEVKRLEEEFHAWAGGGDPHGDLTYGETVWLAALGVERR